MGKKFVNLVKNKNTYQVFCHDVKKIYYLNKRRTPPVPKYVDHEKDNMEVLTEYGSTNYSEE